MAKSSFGFNPHAASRLELWRYGLPQRPDPAIHPQLAARWNEIFSRKFTYITPTFQPMQELVPGINRQRRPPQDLVTFTLPTWSGAVVHAPAGETFTWIFRSMECRGCRTRRRAPGRLVLARLDRHRRDQ